MRSFICLAAFAACLSSGPAWAHVPSGAATLGAGLAHPFLGIDHLAAMIAIGMASAVAGGRALWAWPVAFIAFMSAGFVLAIAGLDLPHVESAIAVSVIVLGLLVIFAARVPMSLAIAVIGIFALCHGYAHGVEAPAAGYLLFAAGMAAATAALHLAGIAVGARFLRRPRHFGTAGGCA